MLGITYVGAALVAYGTRGMYKYHPKRQFKLIVKASFETHKMCHDENKIKIDQVETREYGYHVIITLPSGLTVEKFQKYLPALEQDTYSKVKFRHIKGRKCSLDFGTIDLKYQYNYSDKIPKKELTLPFYSHFGWKTVDFRKESFWHCLLGGATGMGKSALLDYIMVHLFLSMNGHIELNISTDKPTDFASYQHIPQITLAGNPIETRKMLKKVLKEADRRKAMLHRYEARDVKELREEKNIDLPPVFIIIDEYASLAEEEAIQDDISYIARVCRYLDFHLIVSTQRPSSTEAIPPQVRGCLLGNIALACRDEANSKMIIGSDEAAQQKIGAIAGRAVVLEGFTTIVQVPYLKPSQVKKLLESYRSVPNAKPERPTYLALPAPVPGAESGPTGETMLSHQQTSTSSRKSSHAKAKNGRKNPRYPKTKRNVLPVYAEPVYDTPEQHKN